MFRRVSVLLAAGVAFGLAAGVSAAQYVESMLFQLLARDTATFAGAAAVLVAVGVLAAWVPARRAARLDPASVLRGRRLGPTPFPPKMPLARKITRGWRRGRA